MASLLKRCLEMEATRCFVTASASERRVNHSFPSVLLLGTGPIVNGTTGLPLRERWDLAQDPSHWAPTAVKPCNVRKLVWLCPQDVSSSEMTSVENNTWSMGTVDFCGGGTK